MQIVRHDDPHDGLDDSVGSITAASQDRLPTVARGRRTVQADRAVRCFASGRRVRLEWRSCLVLVGRRPAQRRANGFRDGQRGWGPDGQDRDEQALTLIGTARGHEKGGNDARVIFDLDETSEQGALSGAEKLNERGQGDLLNGARKTVRLSKPIGPIRFG